MPTLVRRRLLVDFAERLEKEGTRHPEDAMRAASCRLEATGSAEPELLLRAARLARYGHDFVQVERFARGAIRETPTSEIALLLGEAQHELGEYSAADRVLRQAIGMAADDDPLLCTSWRPRPGTSCGDCCEATTLWPSTPVA